MWYINKRGGKEFHNGKEDWDIAAKLAEGCPNFQLDDEDELVANDLKSCYNCCFRRWTEKSFVCCKNR